MQQHPFELDTTGHNHGSGAVALAFWRTALVVAVVIPLSVAKNGLRIFVLGVLATRVDPSFLTGRLHRQGGIIFLLVALAAIVSLLWMLRRGEQEKPGIG